MIDAISYSIAREICFSPATEDGCIILNIARDSILSLNNTGAFMFAKLANCKAGMTRSQLVDSIASEFDDVEPRILESAVDNLLSQLADKEVVSKAAPETPPFVEMVRKRLTQYMTECLRGVLLVLLRVKARTAAAVLMLTVADALLKFAGFSALHATVKQWKPRQPSPRDSEVITRVCDTVERACVWHPKQKLCLQRSAAVTCLLRSFGVPAEMVIGVHKMPFYGHSWVEVNGSVVNDHKNVQRFFHVLSRC
jgi:hypothetical protein